MAETTDNYPSNDNDGDFIPKKNPVTGKTWIKEEGRWEQAANDIMPKMISHVAGLYRLFWVSTHFPTKLENYEYKDYLEFVNSNVADAMRNSYSKAFKEKLYLGSPSGDCLVKQDADGNYYRNYNMGGLFYKNSTQQCFYMGKTIWDAYMQDEVAKSVLGLPIKSEYKDSANSNYPTVEFEKGKIYQKDDIAFLVVGETSLNILVEVLGGMPVKNANVQLYEAESDTLVYNEIITDENGSYSFIFNPVLGGSYYFIVTKNGCKIYNGKNEPFSIVYNQINEQKITTDKALCLAKENYTSNALISPNGGETWNQDPQTTVTWKIFNNSSTVSLYVLGEEMEKVDPSDPQSEVISSLTWIPFAEEISDFGEYVFNAADLIVLDSESVNTYILIVSNTGEWDISDGTIEIKEPAVEPGEPGTVTKAEVIFAMDTSGSMDDEFEALCKRITDIVDGLKARGIEVLPHVYGITEKEECTEDTIRNIITASGGTPTVNQNEDWGPAVEDLSSQYNWQSGYSRIIIPMSDEGAENGGGWDTYDSDAINRAKEAAKTNQVGVIPIVCSGYSQGQLEGATELAEYGWGDVFLSDIPADDLVSGIIDTITGVVQGVDIAGVVPEAYFDNAWQDPEKVNIFKIPGDIIQMVCKVNNASENEITAKLTFDYPQEWEVIPGAVYHRSNMYDSEQAVDAQYINTDEPGKVTISNITAAPSSVSDEYVVKLIIPTDFKTGNIYEPPITFTVAKDKVNAPQGTTFAGQDKKFRTVFVTRDLKRFILTNRTLLYERYGTGMDNNSIQNEDVNQILFNIQKLASWQQAYVFYIDQWDLYDNFSGINPGCSIVDNHSYCKDDAPLAYWNRDTYCDYSAMSEEQLNKVSRKIDEYTHYWADQTGGRADHHWMLIVGDDQVIPFYKVQDPANYTSHPDVWGHYNASDQTKEMAKNNWVLTESLYQDTDGLDWKKGKVDSMYVGRLVSDNAANFNGYLESLVSKLITSATVSGDGNVLMTSGTGDDCGEDRDFRSTTLMGIYPYFKHSNYNMICQKDGTFSNSCFIGEEWTAGCLMGSENNISAWNCLWAWDHECCEIGNSWGYSDMVFSSVNSYNGHAGTRGTTNFQGKDFGFCFNDLPTFHLFACLAGLADGNDPDLMTYSLINTHTSNILAATGITSMGHDEFFMKKFYEKFTGTFNNTDGSWSGGVSVSIGEALNEAKYVSDNKGSDVAYDLSNFAFTLYGVPWLKYEVPVQSARMTRAADSLQVSVRSSRQAGQFQKNLEISVSDEDYSVVDKYKFQFVEITDFNMYSHNETPVVPVKRIEISIPTDAANIGVVIQASDEADLKTVNIPVFNDHPPMLDEPDYLETPASIGLFDPIAEPVWFEVNTVDHKNIVIDVIPVVFNAETKETTLFKTLNVVVNYETAQEGVVQNVSLDNDVYNAGSSIAASVIIENTVAYAADFQVQGKITDISGQEIETVSDSVNINAGEKNTVTLNFNAITVQGGYTLETVVSDVNGQIGNSTKQFSVSAGNITDVIVPAYVMPEDTAEFSVSFQNVSLESLEVTFKVLFYKGTQFLGETIPVVIDIASGNKETANFQWKIPGDYSGEHRAVASVSFDGGSTSQNQDFYIGSVQDSDGDGTLDTDDNCPDDPNKTEPGECGCGNPETDTDEDGTADCKDNCKDDPNKTEPGECGCGKADTDTDKDGTADCKDECPNDSTNSCNEPIDEEVYIDPDSDGDGISDYSDNCPNDPNKNDPGTCGCGVTDTDTDTDGTPDCNDKCLDDPNKTAPGTCGCGTADTDTDKDKIPDCNDKCPDDPAKKEEGICGCGIAETDTDKDGTPDCNDICPNDPNKVEEGTCGCGTADTDTDKDGTPDCNDNCPNDPAKTEPGTRGCGISEDAPFADAGEDQDVSEGSTVTLDASNSSDPNDAIAAYKWKQTAGTGVTLSDDTAKQPTFVTPPVPVEGEMLSFELMVTDEAGLHDTQEVNIIIIDNSIISFADDVLSFTPSGINMGIKHGENGNIVNLETVADDNISNKSNQPQVLPYGLTEFDVKVNTPGETTQVTLLLSEPVSSDYKYYQYTDENGWQDYSANAAFNEAGDQVTLTLTDGGPEDNDGQADGIIKISSALGKTAVVTPPAKPAEDDTSDGGGSSNCFIHSVGYGAAGMPLSLIFSFLALFIGVLIRKN